MMRLDYTEYDNMVVLMDLVGAVRNRIDGINVERLLVLSIHTAGIIW